MLAMLTAVLAFLDGVTFPITSTMLGEVTEYFNAAITIAAPIGISIMAIILGVKFVPKLIKALTK